jgi:protein-S-isoprenylcysteine O-methyltransferase Ste14
VHDPGRVEVSTAQLFAWMGAGVFVLSLSYFLYRYWTAFGMLADGPLRRAPLVWNVVLFSVFAVHHSVFARQSVRGRLARALGPLERSFYVWVASLLFIAVCKLWLPLPGMVWDLGGAARFALLLLQFGGIAFSVYSAAAIDIWELAGIRQLNSQLPTANSQPLPTANAQTEFEFETTGPYGLVRHPIYLGWFVIVFAVGTMTMTRFVFALVSCAYVLIAIPFEERSLRRSSHGAYERYMQRVPRKLIPGLY